jgi:hypothetical protein
MKKLFRFQYLLILVLLLSLVNSCKKDDNSTPEPEPTPTPTVPSARDSVVTEYNTNYLGSAVTTLGWTGNVSGCLAGTVPDDVNAKVLQRIKYFRKMAKLPTDITFDAAKNAKCQQAALMFKANNDLDHYPPSSWTCYTADGYTAAGSSNIALGMHSSEAISGFIEDFGSNNLSAGHRRWLLYSKSKVMAHGSTDNSCAIWVTGNSGNTPLFTPEFIAWPPKGYVPAPVVYPRWSFGIPGATFTNATVAMKDPNNAAMTVNVISSTQTGVGDNTIVWEPTGVNTTSTSDLKYHVTVSNVSVGGSTKTYDYDVTIIKP